jgi:hypothetical protein
MILITKDTTKTEAMEFDKFFILDAVNIISFLK